MGKSALVEYVNEFEDEIQTSLHPTRFKFRKGYHWLRFFPSSGKEIKLAATAKKRARSNVFVAWHHWKGHQGGFSRL